MAALFALHPLRVDSVAWVTGRKDVLSGLFWMLALGAYLYWVRTRRGWWYGLTVLCFALGLLAKPMVVTLPFVLWLLDYWPLQRWPRSGWWPLVREKIPLLLLAAAASALAVITQTHAQARVSTEALGFAARLANAVVAYATYLYKMVWPAGLACFYPLPPAWSPGVLLLHGLVLVGLTALAVWARRRSPAVLAGWCWYLGTLVPVIGLVQVGSQAYADRFTYLPLIGVWVALAWGLPEWARGRPRVTAGLAGGALATVAVCGLLTAHQLPVWRDSITLYRHALQVTENNWLAHTNLGIVLTRAGRIPEAIACYQNALRINPRLKPAHHNLGAAFATLGRWPEAIAHYQAALRLAPDDAAANVNLGNALRRTNQLAAAITCYQRALRAQPDFAAAHQQLAAALVMAGRLEEAVPHFAAVTRLQPDDAAAHQNLANALWRLGQPAAAAAHFERVLRLDPGRAAALNSLAWLRATAADPALRDGPEAVRLAERGVELTGRRVPQLLDTLGAAYAEAGRWAAAVATAEEAVGVARAGGADALAAELTARLESYRAGRPWRQPPPLEN